MIAFKFNTKRLDYKIQNRDPPKAEVTLLFNVPTITF